MANVKAVIDTRFSKRKNGYQLLIRIQYNSKKKEDISTGEYLPNLDFFDKNAGKVKKRKGIEYERINNLLLVEMPIKVITPGQFKLTTFAGAN